MSGYLDKNFYLHSWCRRWRISYTWPSTCACTWKWNEMKWNEACTWKWSHGATKEGQAKKTNDDYISFLGTHQDILLDRASRKENSRWCMKYLTGSSETTYQCLFIHIWRIYRNLTCNPSAIINTRMFYPTSGNVKYWLNFRNNFDHQV